MDISRQVFNRSVRMGLAYVILGLVMGLLFTGVFGFVPKLAGSVTSGGQTVNVGAVLGLEVAPLVALAGLIITMPVYLLFVSDKNAGVLEYLLAVGMSQRDVFKGYLKAALILSLVAMGPPVLLNLALAPNGFWMALEVGALALVTGGADVAMVTVLMTGFSSMQRKPTGMNSPIGISIGAVILLPELMLMVVLGESLIWLDVSVALGILAAALLLLLSLEKFISREKLLP
jgi:hypothetical protein